MADLTDLRAFLRAAMGRPFAWGTDDCVLFGADWVRWRFGEDPAAGLRGTYADEAGAGRLIADAGSLVAVCEAGLARCTGLDVTETETPAVGDVAVIDLRRRHLVAIRGTRHWIARTEGHGVIASRAPAVRVWRVCRQRLP